MPYGGDPLGDPIDAIRFWAQDVGDPPLLSDAEITYLVSFTGLDPITDPVRIAAYAADAIAGKYVDQVSISADGVNYSGDQLSKRYTELGAELRRTEKRLNETGGYPYAGGVLVGERTSGNVRDPQFGIGMFDNPEAGSQEYGYLGELGESENTGAVGWP